MAGRKKAKKVRVDAVRMLTAALVSLQFLSPVLALDGSVAPGWNDDAIGDPDLVLEQKAPTEEASVAESKPEETAPETAVI
ncbi:MAG: hypothetical protein KC777_23810, partial [Cyanobacteria bacterium HKST-UBA02]|nr:hypothetical protein [Cyanobacteria bacterium HKST-UBA02]